MPSPEQQDKGLIRAAEPFAPSPLPEALAVFLNNKDYVCLLYGTDRETVLVIKVPSREIHSVRDRVPTHLRHELYHHPLAPVIRTLVKLYDQLDRPLALETFTNVADEGQRTAFAALAQQRWLRMQFYDESLTHRLTKSVGSSQSVVIAELLRLAQALQAAIPQHLFDFDMAQREVMRHTTL